MHCSAPVIAAQYLHEQNVIHRDLKVCVCLCVSLQHDVIDDMWGGGGGDGGKKKGGLMKTRPVLGPNGNWLGKWHLDFWDVVNFLFFFATTGVLVILISQVCAQFTTFPAPYCCHCCRSWPLHAQHTCTVQFSIVLTAS